MSMTRAIRAARGLGHSGAMALHYKHGNPLDDAGCRTAFETLSARYTTPPGFELSDADWERILDEIWRAIRRVADRCAP